MSQGNGRFSLCITMCTVRAPFDTNASPQTEHAKGRSPVWILRWISILHLVKIFPQNSHLLQLLPCEFLSFFVWFSLLGEVNLRFFLPTESLLAFSADLERREISMNSPVPLSMPHFLRTSSGNKSNIIKLLSVAMTIQNHPETTLQISIHNKFGTTQTAAWRNVTVPSSSSMHYNGCKTILKKWENTEKKIFSIYSNQKIASTYAKKENSWDPVHFHLQLMFETTQL